MAFSMGDAEMYAGIATQAAGALSSFAGSFYSNRSAKRQAEFQAFMSEMNAKNSERKAQNVLRNAEKEKAAHTLASGRLKASQRAAFAANGLDLNAGSAVEIMADTDIMKEIDAQQIEANAIAQAWGYRMDGVNSKNDAVFARASTAGSGAEVFRTLLTGAAGVAQSWYKLKGSGVIGGNKQEGAVQQDDPILGLYQLNNGWR